MNRRNDEQDTLNNISNIRREILQLCNAPGSQTSDFHKLGFSCLLQKLHEIERILTGLKDMSVNAHSTPQAHWYKPLVMESEQPLDRCHQDGRITPTNLSLPDDLTPFTKRVLFDIHDKIERSFDEFFENTRLKLKQMFEDSYRKLEYFMCSIREKQKAEVRMFIENVLDDCSNCVPIPKSTQPPQRAQSPPCDTPLINIEAVRQTLDCPGIDPQLKLQFFANLHSLNDILSEITEQIDRERPQTSRTASSWSPSIPEVPPQGEQDEAQFQPFTSTR